MNGRHEVELLLEELKRKGVRLLARGDKLRAEGRLSDPLKERIRNNKAALMEIVKRSSGGFEGEWQFELLKIPSQTVCGFVDVWVRGVRLDKPATLFWFANSRKDEMRG